MVATFFKAALQIGPWRISRKVLAFSIGFSIVLILFGIFTLHSHLLNGGDWGDDWDDDWDVDLSSGDSIMLVIMGLAGMSAVLSGLGCCLARHNVPFQLPSDTPVFTLQENNNLHQPVTTVPSAPIQPSPRTRRGTRHVKAGIPEDLQPQDYPSPGYPGPPSYTHGPGGSHAPTHIPTNRSSSIRQPPMDLDYQPATMSDLPPPYAP